MLARVHATTQVGHFKRGPLALTASWSTVDVAQPEVRAALVESVGLHIKVHPLDLPKLAEIELDLVGGRLVDRRSKASPAPVGTSPPAAPPPERKGGRART